MKSVNSNPLISTIGDLDQRYPHLFAPFQSGSLRLPNRLVVAPMTRRAATDDGQATDLMAEYYASFARGGFGLIVTEGVYIDDDYSQAYWNQPGIANGSHIHAWSKVTDAVHQAGGRIWIQLMHAGSLSQGNRYQPETLAPSAIRPAGEQQPSYGGSGPFPLPRALSEQEIDEVVTTFAASVHRARLAGFDGIELHACQGYLLDQFLTPELNQRTDAYGGSLLNRLRFVVDTIEAVRHTAGHGYPVGIRLSQRKINDPSYKWTGGEADAAVIVSSVAAAGATFIHITEHDALASAFGGDRGPTLASLARRYGGLPVIANGKLGDPARAEEFLAGGDADLVALGKAALLDMDWPIKVKAGQDLSPFSSDVFMSLHTL